jgi:hypothetical protein
VGNPVAVEVQPLGPKFLVGALDFKAHRRSSVSPSEAFKRWRICRYRIYEVIEQTTFDSDQHALRRLQGSFLVVGFLALHCLNY